MAKTNPTCMQFNEDAPQARRAFGQRPPHAKVALSPRLRVGRLALASRGGQGGRQLCLLWFWSGRSPPFTSTPNGSSIPGWDLLSTGKGGFFSHSDGFCDMSRSRSCPPPVSGSAASNSPYACQGPGRVLASLSPAAYGPTLGASAPPTPPAPPWRMHRECTIPRALPCLHARNGRWGQVPWSWGTPDGP